jgi:hypothetical protein
LGGSFIIFRVVEIGGFILKLVYISSLVLVLGPRLKFLAGVYQADISPAMRWVLRLALSQVLTGLIMGIRLVFVAKSYQLGSVLATSIDTIVGTRHRPT